MALSLLWERCIAAYLKDVFVSHSNSEATVDSYAYVLRSFFRHTNKAPELSTREDVVSFMAAPNVGRRNHGMAPAPGTRNHRKVIVHQFYSFASRYTVYDGYGRPYKLFVGDNPADGIHGMQLEHRPRYLTEEELVRFFAAIPRDTVGGLRDRAFFLTLFLTARRRAEIANLLYGDITWGVVTSDEQVNHQGYLYAFSGKGKGGQRDSAELPVAAKAAIDVYLEASGRLSTIAADDPVFVAIPRPGMPIDPYKRLSNSAIHRMTKKYAILSGLDPARVHVHIFRHSSAKHRLDNGESIFSLKETLRHKSLDQTYAYARSMQTAADSGAALLMQKFADL
jgi:integrase